VASDVATRAGRRLPDRLFSAAELAFLKSLPMLPSQILLNNLLYDTSQMTIPTDQVDEEQLARPSHWDIAFIRRFMTGRSARCSTS